MSTYKHDRDYFDGDLAQGLLADEEKFIDEYYDSLEEPVEEEHKVERLPELKHQFLNKKLTEGEWKDELVRFKDYRVVKFTNFWKSFFYFLGYTREEICEEGTNRFFWKLSRNKLNDGLFERMKKYTHIGPKNKEYKKYQLLNFIEKNIEGINIEDIENYSFVLSRLYKWLTNYIEMRKEDINKRREMKEKEREERDQAREDHKEWKVKREAAMEDARTEFETKQAEEEAAKLQEEQPEGEDDGDKQPVEKPQFDEEEFYRNYDVENPEIFIPAEVVDDIDNDYEIPKDGDE